MLVAETASGGQYLVFHLGSDEFGLDIRHAREIVRCEPLREARSGPPWLRGLLDVRETAVPVVDLSVTFGRPARPLTAQTCALLVEAGGAGGSLSLGLLADEVSEIVDLQPGDVEVLPRLGPGVRVERFRGMGKSNGRLVLLLDTVRLLSEEELGQARAALEEPPS